MKPLNIENAEFVEKIFGVWPSFHDAEIHNITLTRDAVQSPQMDVAIHHWEMTSEVDSKGHYVLKKHTLNTLRFTGISDLRMEGFNHQNVLWELEIQTLANQIQNSPSPCQPASVAKHHSDVMESPFYPLFSMSRSKFTSSVVYIFATHLFAFSLRLCAKIRVR